MYLDRKANTLKQWFSVIKAHTGSIQTILSRLGAFILIWTQFSQWGYLPWVTTTPSVLIMLRDSMSTMLSWFEPNSPNEDTNRAPIGKPALVDGDTFCVNNAQGFHVNYTILIGRHLSWFEPNEDTNRPQSGNLPWVTVTPSVLIMLRDSMWIILSWLGDTYLDLNPMRIPIGPNRETCLGWQWHLLC